MDPCYFPKCWLYFGCVNGVFVYILDHLGSSWLCFGVISTSVSVRSVSEMAFAFNPMKEGWDFSVPTSLH